LQQQVSAGKQVAPAGNKFSTNHLVYNKDNYHQLLQKNSCAKLLHDQLMLHGFGTFNSSAATATKESALANEMDGKELTDLATKAPSEKRRRPRRRVKNAVQQAAAKEAANEGLSL
jgi:hypothetical protein